MSAKYVFKFSFKAWLNWAVQNPGRAARRGLQKDSAQKSDDGSSVPGFGEAWDERFRLVSFQEVKDLADGWWAIDMATVPGIGSGHLGFVHIRDGEYVSPGDDELVPAGAHEADCPAECEDGTYYWLPSWWLSGKKYQVYIQVEGGKIVRSSDLARRSNGPISYFGSTMSCWDWDGLIVHADELSQIGKLVEAGYELGGVGNVVGTIIALSHLRQL